LLNGSGFFSKKNEPQYDRLRKTVKLIENRGGLMKVSKTSLILVFILSCILTSVGQTSETPAEKRAGELVRLFNAGSRTEFRKYVAENFGAEMRKLPLEQHLGFFSSVHDASRGYQIEGVQETEPNRVTLLLKNKLTGEFEALAVAVEAAAPHRIAQIGFRLPKPPDSGSGKKLSEKQIAAELEVYLKKISDADLFSGAVLLAKDGKIVFKQAYGEAHKDFGAANRVDTKFNLGSMNKMFTAVAVAKLVEDGKLSYEDPLGKFIPDFPDRESAEKIRIKHLLSHTAGLGGYFSETWAKTSREQIRTIDDMMNLVREEEKTLKFEPGTRWGYSNTGMLVLGKVIEIVSGKSYFEYVGEQIYKPAGMADTGCYELDKVNPNLAVGYEKNYTDEGIEFKNNIFIHVMRGGPQGGCYSTVEDLLKFERSLRGGKLVGGETVKLLTSAKPELNSPNYGYGFQTDAGGKSFGHSGGFVGISSNLEIYPESGWTLIVMSNYGRSGQRVMQKMQRLTD
jgi:CubicO group peptidase (beta-lactamase class C family)